MAAGEDWRSRVTGVKMAAGPGSPANRPPKNFWRLDYACYVRARYGGSAYGGERPYRFVLGDAAAGVLFLHRADADLYRGEAARLAVFDQVLCLCAGGDCGAGAWEGGVADGDRGAQAQGEQVSASGRGGFQDRGLCDGGDCIRVWRA